MRLTVAVLITLLFPCFTFGCDLHGFSFGSSPFLTNKNIINISYRGSSFQGNHSHDNYESLSFLSSEDYSESFNYLDISGAFNVIPNIQLIANIPLVYNFTKGDQHGDMIYQGIGDISVLATINLTREIKSYFQSVSFTCGLNFPTGSHNTKNTINLIDHDLQVGTGRSSSLIGIGYNMFKSKTGLEAMIAYKTFGKNDLNYRFSNRLNFKTSLFYKLSKSNLKLYPKAGIYFETANKDEYNYKPQNNSGGSVFFFTCGANANYKNTVISIENSIVGIEKLNGIQGKNKNRLNIKLTYIIK